MRTGGRRSPRRAAPILASLGLGAVSLVATACSSGSRELSAEELRPPASFTVDERAVIDTYARFRDELTRTTATIDGSLETVESLASPRLGDALVETIVADRSVGNIVTGSYEFVPLSVTFDGDGAEILLCEWDQTYVVNEGEQLSDVPEAPSTARVDMTASDDGGWLVNGVFDGEGQACELAR